MAKVSLHLGFTFRVGPLDTNQYGRVDLHVADIDTELDTKEQLDAVHDTTDSVWTYVKSTVDSQLDEVLDSNG